MTSKPHPAYTVADSPGTYGAATPYAVVSTSSGMPHLPAHGSKDTARQEANRLNEEAERAAKKGTATAAAKRTVDRLRAEASTTRDADQEGELT
jgi:hypothetical protein